jgi:hypothetical protein
MSLKEVKSSTPADVDNRATTNHIPLQWYARLLGKAENYNGAIDFHIQLTFTDMIK